MTDTDIIYGIHAVQAALGRPGAVASLWVQADRHDRRVQPLLDTAAGQGITVKRVSRREIDQVVPGGAHQGIVAFTRAARPSQGTAQATTVDELVQGIAGPPLLLVLDGVQDPHNLGACLRTAAAAGAHGVIAPRDRAAGITPTVRKVASGAAELIPFIQVTNLARTLAWLQDNGVWTVGMAGDAPSTLYEMALTGPVALVMGGEGKGLRRLTRAHCDYMASIPLSGAIESLNVSVATGIGLFEAARQRRAGRG